MYADISTSVSKEQKETARELLKSLELSRDGCVYVIRDRIRWSFYIERGKLVYASHSLDSFERLERHLRMLSREVPALNDKMRSELRLMFDDPSPDNAKYKVTSEILCVEYLAILWLVNENYLPKTMASKLVARIIQEVIEAFLGLQDGKFGGMYYEHFLKETYCNLSIDLILEIVTQRLQEWYKLGPAICSPYQCPYLVSQKTAEKRMSTETVQRLGRILRGFNFCQLGALLGKDPLAIAKHLVPLISDGSILLREPLAPLNMLPRTYYLAPAKEHDNIEKLAETFAIEEKANTDNISSISKIVLRQSVKTSKIVCIDDSESMLGIISSYLGNEDFQITLIQDSMKALMKINSICPDLILLDIGMPNVDGYQLCSLIRKSSNFKYIPIVMVTANKGLINRARANIAGATDYLTKPFNQADLLKMVMRHLM
ncbi:response regulator [Pseudanabaena sp. UWO311]|uniref:response regulator n=1 Tax=Pseudanabaena sp. UWO311 TaxID=2487337 RepID=UPI0011575619|nr:response regulator [Pseudanabaena sp. UWO311]TYQ25854.1 response regulator [Pseudanabaena sp. UWO311]